MTGKMTGKNFTYADLYRKHSWMYAPKRTDGLLETIHIGHGIECGPGWLLLLDDALTKIGREARAGRNAPNSRSCRSRKSMPRFPSITTAAISGSPKSLSRAEAVFERTCEDCGEFVLPHIFDEEWYSTLCAARSSRSRSVEYRSS